MPLPSSHWLFAGIHGHAREVWAPLRSREMKHNFYLGHGIERPAYSPSTPIAIVGIAQNQTFSASPVSTVSFSGSKPPATVTPRWVTAAMSDWSMCQ
jgi:hypothetical protein